MKGNGATLAVCQAAAIAPTSVDLAVQIVSEVARALRAVHARTDPKTGRRLVHGNVSPESIVIRYDGTAELLEPSDAARTEALRSRPAYLAPEQVSASDVDQRADVFALGVVLWELLTSTRLFARESASATRIAIVEDPILNVRDVNPEVPALLGQVLGAALERDRAGRFDTVEAFQKALAGSLSSSGAKQASTADVGRWVTERVPPSATPAPPGLSLPAARPPSDPSLVPDLDIRGASRAHRSQSAMDAVKVPSTRNIPVFDTNALAAAALAPNPARTSSAPSLGSSPSLAPRVSSNPSLPSLSDAPPVSGGGKSIAFDAGDEDDFDMEIERNVANVSIPTATSARTSGAPGRTSGGLELAAPSRMVREGARAPRDEDEEPSTGGKMLARLVALVLSGATAFALWRYVHRTGGLDVTRALPHAFDGTSATESGALSLLALAVAVAVGFIGLRFKPHAWGIIASGGVLLFLSLAMVTVTLASTGESPTPPDGVLLVPYLFPAAVLLLALGLMGRAARLFALGGVKRRLATVPVAAIAGLLAFLAFEASGLAR